MSSKFEISSDQISLSEVLRFVVRREAFSGVALTDDCLARVRDSHEGLSRALSNKVPLYGVTTVLGIAATA